MPGFFQAEDDGVVDHRHAYGERKPITGFGGVPRPSLHIQTHRGPSFPPTTAYGLNEPQWIAGGPPSLIYELSPYARVPLPPLFSIHPILSFEPFHEQPALTWSIEQPPKYASPTPGRSDVNLYHWKSLPATDPVTSIPLSIRIEWFTSLIVVHPSKSVVTVGDVLAAVYTGARRCVTERLCINLGIDPRMIGAMRDYENLVTRDGGPSMGDDEVSTNVRASTNFQTRWAGLTPSRKEQDVWILQTRSMAR